MLIFSVIFILLPCVSSTEKKLVLFHLAKCVRSFITASAILCTSEGNEIKQWILSVTVMEACLIKSETDKDLVFSFSASYVPPLCYRSLILCLSKVFWTCTRVPVQFHSFLYLVQSGSQIWAGPHSHLVKLLAYWGCLHCSRSSDPFLWYLYTAEGKVPALHVQKAHQGWKLFLPPEATGALNLLRLLLIPYPICSLLRDI